MERPPPTEVRDATPADAPRVIATLSRAFDTDPVFEWVFPDPATRAQRVPKVFDLFFAGDAPPGMRLVTPDCAAATLWRAPDMLHEHGGGLGEAWRMWRVAGGGILRFKRVGDAVEGHYPSTPFWYLHIAGCDPARQGEGLGRAVVQAGLDRIGGAPVYLETAKQGNLGFYESLGFHVREEWSVPNGGPRFWSMLRPSI